MTINNNEMYEAGVWDWGFLDDCFGETNIRLTDIDGAVERHGKYLFIETKQPGVDIPVGQKIFFDGQVKQGNAVMFVWGHKNQPERIRVITPHVDKTFESADTELMKEIVSGWFKQANKSQLS